MADDPSLAGPYIRWTYYGYEGWHPSSYDTLEEAINSDRFGERIIITKRVQYEIKERDG